MSAISETFQELVAAAARETRERVADQLHDLVLERSGVGSPGEFTAAVQHVGHVGRRLTEARGRQQQARELGLPLAPAVREEAEALELLRAAVARAGEAAGSWVVAMDLEAQRPVLEQRAQAGES